MLSVKASAGVLGAVALFDAMLYRSGEHPVLAIAVSAAAVGLAVLLWQARHGTASLVARWERGGRRSRGTASRWQVWRTSSAVTMRRRAVQLRPSLAAAGRIARWRTPVRTYATPLCRVGRQRVWTTCEESTLRVGIPGTGKTAEMACRVIDAPGGAVVTSTAADLYELTEPLRSRRGPVSVINPGGIGGVASTLRWSPLAGCADPATAHRRAADLIGPGSGSDEGRRWEIQGQRVLAVFLHAAALGGYRMRDVLRWTTNPDAARAVVLAALEKSPARDEMRQTAAHAIDTNPRTRDGFMIAVAPALTWVTHPAAAAVGDVDPSESFDLADLLDRRGTLYLLGDDDGTVGPLIAALVAEIVHQARRAAATRPGGRLDLGLMLALDELALICFVPVDRWMAELRKRNIHVDAAVQGLGQLRERWGRDRASMIVNNAAAVLVYGGCKDPDDLAAFSALAGDRDELTPTRDASGGTMSTTVRRTAVVPTAMLAGLPNHHAMLIRRGMRVALATTPIAWRRPDVRRSARAAAKSARYAGEAKQHRTANPTEATA